MVAAGCQLHFEWQGGETQVRDEKGMVSLANTVGRIPAVIGMIQALQLTGLLTNKSS